MARSNLPLSTYRVPTKRVRAEAIKAKMDDMDQALDAATLHEYLGAPDLATDNRFLNSVNMQATAYTLDETTLPADNPPRNVSVTHTQVGGVSDTLGDLVVVGTDVNDEAITETITISDGGVAVGTKAFKTVTSLITADWVIDTTEDTIEVGFGALVGLSRTLAAATDVVLATLAGIALLPSAIAVDAAVVSENTINISGGTFDSAKVARALVVV